MRGVLSFAAEACSLSPRERDSLHILDPLKQGRASRAQRAADPENWQPLRFGKVINTSWLYTHKSGDRLSAAK
jgi:hypothetical protein